MTIRKENVGDALKIVIGPRLNWLGLFAALAVLLILWGVGIEPAWDGLKLALSTGRSVGGFILGLTALSGPSLFICYGIVLSLFGLELVTISATDLEIRNSVFGWSRSERSFPISTIESLRYEKWPGGEARECSKGCALNVSVKPSRSVKIQRRRNCRTSSIRCRDILCFL